MDRDGNAPAAKRLIANPTAQLIADVLVSVDSSTHAKWCDGLDDPRLPRVTANGLSVPIVRVPWNKVDDFFETLFSSVTIVISPANYLLSTCLESSIPRAGGSNRVPIENHRAIECPLRAVRHRRDGDRPSS